MELTVRVMMAGREVDRALRTPEVIDGNLSVRYRRRDWVLSDGCIHIDALNERPTNLENLTVIQPFLDLMALPLTVSMTDCTTVLRSSLPDTPDAVVVCLATLAQLGLKSLAEEVLIDFLELQRRSAPPVSTPPQDTDHRDEEADCLLLDSTGGLDSELPEKATLGDDLSFEWQPEAGWDATDTDDSNLRELAENTQRLLSTHVAVERGLQAVDLCGPDFSNNWEIVSISKAIETVAGAESLSIKAEKSFSASTCIPNVEKKSSDLPLEHLTSIAQKTAALSGAALGVLRYFADNPHDKSSHAEEFTGIPRGMINALLTGTLSQYVEKSEGGGWACHEWVADVLAIMNGDLK